MISSYEEGIRAYRAGIDLEACPYNELTSAHRDWIAGWLDACEYGL